MLIDSAGQGLHIDLLSRTRVACSLIQQYKGCILIYSAGQGLLIDLLSRTRVAC